MCVCVLQLTRRPPQLLITGVVTKPVKHTRSGLKGRVIEGREETQEEADRMEIRVSQ